MKRILFLLLASELLLTACDGARRSEVIDRMRVLGIKAEPPTALPGDKVRLEALVATKVENDGKLQLSWFMCLTDFDTCAEADVPGGEGIVMIGTGPVATVELDEDTLAGDTVLFWLEAKRGDEHERSIKGVYVRPAGEPANRNPKLDRVRWGGGSPIATMAKDDRVSVRLASSEMMNELILEAGEPAAEDVEISTYVTDGELVDPSGTGASGELYFQSPPKKTRVGTWIVVNDGRGGIDWFQHWINVEGKKP